MITLSGTVEASEKLVLTWDPPNDGVTVGYLLWYGLASGDYDYRIDVGSRTTQEVQDLLADTAYCFAVQAYDASGQVSEMSDEICKRTPITGSTPSPAPSPAPSPSPVLDPREIVVYASSRAASGHWGPTSSTGAAEGRSMATTNTGWSSVNLPHASPLNYFDVEFTPLANTTYRVWLRMRAAGDSKWNDSVWVQFSGATVNGASAYRIGTTSALMVNLERCNACGTRGWGWMNSAYWLKQANAISFPSGGVQRMRIQTREDGVEIDQVVLSAVKYLNTAPGPQTGDTTILPVGTATQTSGRPYKGIAPAMPGTIEAAHFDEGGNGVAYLDSTAGNAGGALRATDVDLQPSSEGGYNVGWITAGEWLAYTVNVTSARAYTVSFRVASIAGGTLELRVGSLTRTVIIPNTGGWQKWVTVTTTATMGAGVQTIRVRFPSGGANLRKIEMR